MKPSKHSRCGGMWRYLTGWALRDLRLVKILYCDRCFGRKAVYPRKK